MVLVSEPGRGRSRATELPCFMFIINYPLSINYCFSVLLTYILYGGMMVSKVDMI